MAGTLTLSTISDGTNSTSATNCIQGSAKAWVNFNGTTAAIRASYNVSSVTRNSTGNYTVNMTNALVDANYAVTAVGDFTLGVDGLPIVATNSDGTNGSKTTTAFGITSFIPSFSLSDIQGVFVAVFR